MSRLAREFDAPSLLMLIVCYREVVLPLESYDRVLDCIKGRNFLVLTTDFERRTPIPYFASNLLQLSAIRNTLVSDICEAADTEIAESAKSTLLSLDSVHKRLN